MGEGQSNLGVEQSSFTSICLEPVSAIFTTALAMMSMFQPNLTRLPVLTCAKFGLG